MDELTPAQRATLERVVAEIAGTPGLVAIALGGSHARGRAGPYSDLDVGLYYRDAAPLDIDAVRAAASRLNDSPNPVVSGLGGWGRWVDGGAWLTIGGQRVDLLYRSLDMIERTLAEARAGNYEIDHEQQPPYGFFGPTILGEVAIARPLRDERGEIERLKTLVSPMPPALVRAVVLRELWGVDFGLSAFAPKYAAAGNVYALAGCLTRFAHAMTLALFALNGAYLLNDKTALAETEDFAISPPAFSSRISKSLASIGADADDLRASLAAFVALFSEMRDLAGELYQPVWRF